MSLPDNTPKTRFEAQIRGDEACIDLVEASLLIAAEHNPRLDIHSCRQQMSELSVRASLFFEDLPDIKTDNTKVIADQLCVFLKTEEGFSGNEDDYYDPDNSYLDQVLHRRSGIPISLALIYIHVARELGCFAEGVGFPGHFLVKIGAEKDCVLIDPFAGVPLSREDCREMLHVNSQGTMVFSDKLLEPTGSREILQRILRNLKIIYLQRQDLEESLGLCDWLLLVDPNSTQDIFDRAMVLEKLSCYGLAADELERLVTTADLQLIGSPTADGPSQREALRKKIERLRELDQPSVH